MNEADLYRQVDQHSHHIHQRVDDHKVWQEYGTEFEDKPGKEGEGQEHSQTPQRVAAIQDERPEHVLRGKEEGGDEPRSLTVLELRFEPRHPVTEIGRQFGEGNCERKKKAHYECPGG